MSLVHYTDANALKSIFEKPALWLTDIRFLNDAREFNSGIEFIRKAAFQPIQSLWFNFEHVDGAIDFVRESISNDVSFSLSEDPLFVCSFSKSKDLLSQWRGYGMYAIEFDRKALSEYLPSIRDCIYSDHDKQEHARRAITKSAEIASKEMGTEAGRVGIKTLDALSEITGLAATFKEVGFQEENEVRSIVTSDSTGSDIRFRARGDLIIPYIEMEIGIECIKSVQIGPVRNADLAKSSIEKMVEVALRRNQVNGGNIEHEIEVQQTALSYRSMS